jgi:deazaflavin-dependent oxidoreductase (nitroreductase family)
MDQTTWFAKALTKIASATHRQLYRRTGGRLGHRTTGATRFLLLTHVGAKSGVSRTTPLYYFTDGDDLVIVASLGGAPKNPAWLHNLKANPETSVQVGREVRAVRARVATEDERTRLWPMAVKGYRPYASYQERADQAGRTIPLVILQRR